MRLARALVAVLASALAVVGTAAGFAPAADATTYRYWIYWHGVDGGGWQYSQVGPVSWKLADGGVDGWRFGRGAASSSAAEPRVGSEYGALCPSHPATAEGYQVAVVVDYGNEPDSPGYATRAYCFTFSSRPTGAQVLSETGLSVRVDSSSGLVCAIRGYPKPPECGKTSVEPAPAPTSPRPVATTRPPSPAPATSGPAHQKWARPENGASSVAASARPDTASQTAGPSSTPSTGAVASVGTASAGAEPGVAEPAEPGSQGGTPLPVGLVARSVLGVAVGGAAAWRARR
jgi:hypothetical protein